MARFRNLELDSNPEESGPTPQTQAAAPRAAAEAEQSPLRLADQHRRRGEYESALRYYSRALELDKNLVAAWVAQVQMLVLLAEAPEADLWSRKALELFPGNGELLAARAQALCRIGDTRQAGPTCDGAMSAAGKSPYRWLVRGEWMVATRQRMDEHCFTKARELDRDWLIPLEAALIYLHYSYPSRALIRAREAVEAAPDQFYTWYVRGCAEAELEMIRGATVSFQRCLQLCPGHADAATRLQQLGTNWSFGRMVRNWFRRGH